MNRNYQFKNDSAGLQNLRICKFKKKRFPIEPITLSDITTPAQPFYSVNNMEI